MPALYTRTPRMAALASCLASFSLNASFAGDIRRNSTGGLGAGNGCNLYESSVEFSFGRSSHALRAGVLDLYAEFDTPVTQGIFTASPFGIGTEVSQTGARGPGVWPTTGLGLRAAGEFTESLHWRFSAYDGAPGTDCGFELTRERNRQLTAHRNSAPGDSNALMQ